jgi:hypothetical protein
MAIIINFLNGGKLIARGERLGVVNSILAFLGRPFWLRSKFTDARYLVNPASWTHVQPLTDDEFSAQMTAAHAQQEAERKRNPKPGDKPRLVVPVRP